MGPTSERVKRQDGVVTLSTPIHKLLKDQWDTDVSVFLYEYVITIEY